MSQYLNSLKIGDVVEFRGPSGLLTYTGKGNGLSPPQARLPLLQCPLLSWHSAAERVCECAHVGEAQSCPSFKHSTDMVERHTPQLHLPQGSVPSPLEFSSHDCCGDA